MKWTTAVLVLGVALAGGAAGLWAARQWSLPPEAPVPAGVTAAKPGDKMPPLTLLGLDGARHPLRAPADRRPVLVNVWATWCEPCRAEMQELQRYSVAEGAAGTQVVGIALDDAEAVRHYMAQAGITYPTLLDMPGPADASVWLGNRRGLLPYTVLVGADGRIVRQKLGPFADGEIAGWAD